MPPLLNKTLRRLALLLLAVAAGCTHVTSRGPQVEPYSDQQAMRLLQSGKLEAAAAEFQTLAGHFLAARVLPVRAARGGYVI